MFNRHWSKGLSLKVVTVVGSMYNQRMFNWEITMNTDGCNPGSILELLRLLGFSARQFHSSLFCLLKFKLELTSEVRCSEKAQQTTDKQHFHYIDDFVLINNLCSSYIARIIDSITRDT